MPEVNSGTSACLSLLAGSSVMVAGAAAFATATAPNGHFDGTRTPSAEIQHCVMRHDDHAE